MWLWRKIRKEKESRDRKHFTIQTSAMFYGRSSQHFRSPTEIGVIRRCPEPPLVRSFGEKSFFISIFTVTDQKWLTECFYSKEYD